MKTTLGRLAAYACIVLAAIILFLPMRAGREDKLILGAYTLSLKPGERFILGYALEDADDFDMYEIEKRVPNALRCV